MLIQTDFLKAQTDVWLQAVYCSPSEILRYGDTSRKAMPGGSRRKAEGGTSQDTVILFIACNSNIAATASERISLSRKEYLAHPRLFPYYCLHSITSLFVSHIVR